MVLAGASLPVYPLMHWYLEQPLEKAEHECRCHSSVYGGFWKYFVLLQLQRALSHLEICALFPPGLVFCSPVSVVWVLLLECRELDLTVIHALSECCLRNTVLDSSGDSLVTSAMLGSTVDTCSASVFGFWTNFAHFFVEVDSN